MLESVPKFKIEQIKKTKTRIECQNISYLMFYYNFTIIPISFLYHGRNHTRVVIYLSLKIRKI